jgi:hypothetical protein
MEVNLEIERFKNQNVVMIDAVYYGEDQMIIIMEMCLDGDLQALINKVNRKD